MLCLLLCLLNYVLNGNAIFLPCYFKVSIYRSFYIEVSVCQMFHFSVHNNTRIIRPDFFSVHIKAFNHQRSSLYQRPEALPKINVIIT